MKIGFICWRQGGGTSDFVTPNKQPWLKDVQIVKSGENKGLIPFEKALIAFMKYKYKDIEINYINKFDRKLLEQNDVNFLLSLNLLNAWEGSKSEYNRVYKLMEDKSLNIYPNLREQLFLYDKGNYLQYFQKNGIPIAPTFVIKTDRNVEKIVKRVKKEGWESFVLKPHRAYASVGVGRFNTDDKNLEKKVKKYLEKNKQFPGFVCQQMIDGFGRFYEIKSYWINGKFSYYVAMKVTEIFKESEIYNSDFSDYFGSVSPTVLKDVKRMGKKILSLYPKLNKYSHPPLFVRMDFGCCIDNKLDGKNYFLNEIEYAGCSTLIAFSPPGSLEKWVQGYYKKALEFKKTKRKTKSRKRITRRK